MYGNNQIARVAEETVLCLKDLESRIELLKNDLGVLCTSIGLPEVARIAVTPARWIDPRIAQIETARLGQLGIVSPYQNVPSYGNVTPYQGFSPNLGSISPFSLSPGIGQLAFTPWTASPYGTIPSSFIPAYGNLAPTLGSPLVSPLASTIPQTAVPGFAGFR
jgi:hypothetical protein